MCSDDSNINSATPWWKLSIIVYEKNLNSCHSPSHIEYACAVWSGGPQAQRLQHLQDLFSKRHGIMLPPYQKKFDYHTLVLLYRTREKLAPDHLFSLLPPPPPPPHIEHIWLFAQKALRYCPLYKKSATLNSFLRQALTLWNTLLFDVQPSKSLGMIKSKLKLTSRCKFATHFFPLMPIIYPFTFTLPLYLLLTGAQLRYVVA